MKVFKLLKKDSYEDKLKRSIPTYTAEGSEASADFIKHEASLAKYDHRKMSNDLDDWPIYKNEEQMDHNKTASVEVITESELSGYDLKSQLQELVSGQQDTTTITTSHQSQDVSPVETPCSAGDLPSFGELNSSNKEYNALEHCVVISELETSMNPFEEVEQDQQEEVIKSNPETEKTSAVSTGTANSLSLPSATSKRPSVQELVECWENMTEKDAQISHALVNESKQRSNPFDDKCCIDVGLTSLTEYQSKQVGCLIEASEKGMENSRNMPNDNSGHPLGPNGASPKQLQEGEEDSPPRDARIDIKVGPNGHPIAGQKSWSFNDRLKHKASFSDDVFPQFGSDRWFKRKYKYSQDWITNYFPQQTSQLTAMLGAVALFVIGLLLVFLLFMNLIDG